MRCTVAALKRTLHFEANRAQTSPLRFVLHRRSTCTRPQKRASTTLHGNVWEWCEDHFNGLEGFEPHYLYDDFSSPCFDRRHTMIMGGSWASTGDEASVFARFAFRRHFFQHLGFRLVKNAGHTPARRVGTRVFVLGADAAVDSSADDAVAMGVAVVPSTNGQFEYERDVHVERSLVRDYGTVELFDASLAPIVAPFVGYSQRLVSVVMDALKAAHVTAGELSLLQIGCEVGGVAFELSRHFAQVVAVDYVGRFIEAALTMQRSQRMSFDVTMEGDARKTVVFERAADVRHDRVTFKQLTWLPVEIGLHDVVVITHFLTRASNPKAWVLRMKEVLRPGGFGVVICDPWPSVDNSNGIDTQAYPPQSKWLAGHNHTHTTADTITSLLGEGFSLVSQSKFPYASRDGSRGVRLLAADALVYRKRQMPAN
eukprot:Opistho-2@14014